MQQNFEITIRVGATAPVAFECINDVGAWWTENVKGHSQHLNDEFTVQFGDIHFSRQKIVEFIPDQKVVWLITESNLSFVEDKKEWTNTKVIFEIFPENGQTLIRFTHEGLVPEIECFDACSGAWSQYIRGSLLQLVNTGRGEPTKKETTSLQ